MKRTRNRQDGATPAGGRRAPSPNDPAEVCYRQAEYLLTQRRYAEAEPLLREALRLRPDNPDIMNQLGSALWEQGKPEESEPFFARASALKPDDWMIRNNLGLSYWDQGRPADAIRCYREILERNPGEAQPRMNLGVALSDLGLFDEALEHLLEALRLNPESADANQNVGMTLGRMGQWERAIHYYEHALALAPDYAEVRRNRAYAWLYLGNFELGWREHEWRLKCRRHIGCDVLRPAWRGEDLGGRAILLHAEQGYGDTFQFIRYASMVRQRGGVVFVLCQTNVIRIVARCPGVTMAFDGTTMVPECDLHAPLMSLPAIFGTTQATVPAQVPYLPTEPAVVERWRIRLAEAVAAAGDEWRGRGPGGGGPAGPMLVGVVWQGSVSNPMDRWRSFPLAKLAPLAEVPGVRLVSLQVADGLDQLRTLDGRMPIIELEDRRPRTFVDSAAIISQLDLVVTPDTSVAHLAGGLGVPVWMAMSTVGEWRWMTHREDSPWYPTMRLFRQTKLGDWDDVFRRMADALGRHRATRGASAA